MDLWLHMKVKYKEEQGDVHETKTTQICQFCKYYLNVYIFKYYKTLSDGYLQPSECPLQLSNVLKKDRRGHPYEKF